jgi:hypothetical protein
MPEPAKLGRVALEKGKRAMRDHKWTLAAFVSRRQVTAVALLILLTLGAMPAKAQDLFGFFRLFSPQVVRAPVYQPYTDRVLPGLEPRVVHRRPKVVRVDPPPIKVPLKPKAPGEVTNPVPELLVDSTLRRGDVVMFPDGPRVFTGEPAAQHAMADFEPVSRAGTAVPSSTRKLVANLLPGRNDAWSAEKASSGGKLALKRERL